MDKIVDVNHKRVRIEYYDHNEPFGKLLPREGIIEKRYVTGNVDDWYLFKLDIPFEYEGKIQKYFLIRSKWSGEVINNKENCGVFILLIPDMKLLNSPEIEVKDFIHVAWGFALVI